MSVDISVFLHDHRLPSRDEWQAAITARGYDLYLYDFGPREQTGFVPCTLNGKECGFEYWFSPVEPEEWVDISARIGDRDRVVTLTFHSSEADMHAATTAAATLTALADGVYFDGDSFAAGDRVYGLLEEQARASQQRLRENTERRWAHTTDRRCPKCGAPCPEYRAHCFVCKFEIGRVRQDRYAESSDPGLVRDRHGWRKRWWEFWK